MTVKMKEVKAASSKFMDESHGVQSMIKQIMRMPQAAVNFVNHIQTVQSIERSLLASLGALALPKVADHGANVGLYDNKMHNKLVNIYRRQYHLINGMSSPPVAFASTVDMSVALHAMRTLSQGLPKLVFGHHRVGEEMTRDVRYVHRVERGQHISVGALVPWKEVQAAFKALHAVCDRAVQYPRKISAEFHVDRTFEAVVLGMVMRLPLLQLTRLIHMMEAAMKEESPHMHTKRLTHMVGLLKQGEELCRDHGFGGERWRVAFDREAMALVADLVNNDKQGVMERLKYEMKWWGKNGGRTLLSTIVMTWVVNPAIQGLLGYVGLGGVFFAAFMMIYQLGYARYLQSGMSA